MTQTIFLLLALVALPNAASAADPVSIPGIGPTGPLRQIKADLAFAEGPAADAAGNLCFTNIPAAEIWKVDLEGNVALWMNESRLCNGLMFDSRGRLVACQRGLRRVVAFDMTTKAATVVADTYAGRPFNAPNDLVIDSVGGVYFSDPAFARENKPEQDKTGVYYVVRQGQVTRLIDDLPNPNGVILSPDETTLYVAPVGKPAIIAYDVLSPGKIGAGRVFCELEPATNPGARGGDGLAMDVKGNLYVAQPTLQRIHIVDSAGKTLGDITVPENPTNCDFGGSDRKTLFITTRSSLYAIPIAVAGHRFAAGR